MDGIPLWAGLLAIPTVWVWQNESTWMAKRDSLFEPLAYGLIVSISGILLLVFAWDEPLRWWLASLGFLGCTLFLIVTLLRNYQVPISHPIAIWCIAVLLFLAGPAFFTPGILAGIFILLLGFWRGNRLVGLLGSLLLVLFIGRFYYDLDFTLLTKSYMLVAGGLVLLAARTIFNRLPSGTRSE